MTFEVTYRETDGRPVVERIEADDRVECLRKCKVQGMNTISIRLVGGSRGASPKGGAIPDWRHRRIVVATGVLLAAAIGGGVWWRAGRGTSPVADATEDARKHAPPVAGPARPANPSDPVRPVRPTEDAQKRVPPTARPVPSPGVDATERVPPETTEGVPPAEPPEESPAKPKAFKTGAEQLLAMLIPASPGAPVPPLPALTEEGVSNDLAKALKAEIVIEADDTEETATLKENVAALKQQYRELRKAEGWSFTEYLDALRTQGEEDAAVLGEARRELRELSEDPDVSDAEYLRRADEINALLRERGLPEIGK